MMKTTLQRLMLIGAVLLGSAMPLQADEKPSPKVVAYVPNWVDLDSFTKTIDYDKLTHINIAFENPTNDLGDLSFHKANDVLIAACRAKGVKVLVSIGGGAASGNKKLTARYFDLISEAKRSAFAERLATYVVDHHFDGLDVDIEGPAINKDYGAFIHSLSSALKPKGMLLTACSPKGTVERACPIRSSNTSTS